MLFGVLVYAAFVLWVGTRQLSAALDHFNWTALAFALCLSSGNYLLRFLKWEFYLKELEITGVPKSESLLIFLSGFVLTVTPGKVGEVLKSAVLYRTHQVDPARTAPIVIAERLTDVIAIVLLVVLGSLGFEGGLVWALFGVLAVGLGLTLILWQAPLDWLLTRLEGGSARARSFVPKLTTARDSLRIVAAPRALLLPTFLSLLGWSSEGYSLYLLLDGLGQTVSVSLSTFFYATMTLAGALVPLPGGLGVAEALIQTQLVQLGGVEPAASTAAMLMIRFTTLWWAVLVGFLALGLLKLKYPTLLAFQPSARSRDNA